MLLLLLLLCSSIALTNPAGTKQAVGLVWSAQTWEEKNHISRASASMLYVYACMQTHTHTHTHTHTLIHTHTHIYTHTHTLKHSAKKHLNHTFALHTHYYMHTHNLLIKTQIRHTSMRAFPAHRALNMIVAFPRSSSLSDQSGRGRGRRWGRRTTKLNLERVWGLKLLFYEASISIHARAYMLSAPNIVLLLEKCACVCEV